MPRSAIIIRVFLATPSDVEEERKITEKIINELNITWSRSTGIWLELIKWETHVVPGVGDDGQDVINCQIKGEYDIFIGILWKTFGTPTSRFASGTEEEFEIAYKKHLNNPDSVKILFYINDAPAPLSEIDPAQLSLINQFQIKIKNKGLLFNKYNDLDEYEDRLRIHLSLLAQDFQTSAPKSKDIISGANDSDAKQNIDEPEEYGLLDFMEMAEENMTKTTDTIESMTLTLNEFTDKITEKTDELSDIQSSQSTQNTKDQKTFYNKTAEVFEELYDRMNEDEKLFADYSSKTLISISKAIALLSDFENEPKDLLAFKDQIMGFRATIDNNLVSTKKLASVFKSQPRITKRFNNAKRNAIQILDKICDDFIKVSQLSLEVEEAIDKHLEQN